MIDSEAHTGWWQPVCLARGTCSAGSGMQHVGCRKQTFGDCSNTPPSGLSGRTARPSSIAQNEVVTHDTGSSRGPPRAAPVDLTVTQDLQHTSGLPNPRRTAFWVVSRAQPELGHSSSVLRLNIEPG